MKKFQVLVAVALLAVAGTGLAVTCAQDNVPGATLLVPYFKVSRNGSTGGDIPQGGTDTLVAITNVSTTGVIAHVTVWTKYSVPVLDFNVPMTGNDVAYFSMRDILNGKLNVNAKWQSTASGDICLPGKVAIGGFGATTFQRFTNPDDRPNIGDRVTTTALYANPAFSGVFRQRVWTSLDESGDISSLSSWTGANIVDQYNFACDNLTEGLSVLQGEAFSGYVTIDVVNYCTNWFPDEVQSYMSDAIATVGWGRASGPNVLMGDVFFVDPALSGGNISGDPAVSLEFDSRLDWLSEKTFYGRYWDTRDVFGAPKDFFGNAAYYSPTFAGLGDGREPLGLVYGFRYLWDGQTSNPALRTWAIVWRSDQYNVAKGDTLNDLCGWYMGAATDINGFEAADHGVGISIYDLDETKVTTTTTGGPSGYIPPTTGKWIFLETQRLVVTPNTDFVPTSSGTGTWSNGGWIITNFKVTNVNDRYAQAWVGVQHSGAGLAVSVGHGATLLDNQFQCWPATSVFLQAGNQVF